ncbi:MAG: hypothetical protein ABJA82_12475 [Myxococcales bacterium]
MSDAAMTAATVLLAAPELARARALGIVSPGCEGCHGGGHGMAEVSMTASPRLCRGGQRQMRPVPAQRRIGLWLGF